MRSTLSRIVALLLVLSMVAAACGGDRESTGGGGGETGDPSGEDPGGEGGEALIDTSGCADYQPTQGITDDKIVLGSSLPQSGLFAAFAGIKLGYDAYLAYANAELNGVGGRQVEVIAEDDAYEPGQTNTNIGKLTQEDGVFGLFNVVGTAHNLGIRDDLNEQCIPQLFNATGSEFWGDPTNYPWTIGSFPAYPTEMAVLVEYLNETNPSATIAVLAQNDDFGDGYVDSLRVAIEGTDLSLLDVQTYEAGELETKSQITTLAATDADTLILGATSLSCPGALSEAAASAWDPLIYLSATCTSGTIIGLAENASPGSADGVMSSIWLKDPLDPQWDGDEAMALFREKGAEYGLTAEDLDNGIVGYGWTMAALLIETLNRADDLTRVGVMEAAWTLQDVSVGLLLPGTSINTDFANDPFVIERLQLATYNGDWWEFTGEASDFEGRTGDVLP